MTLRTGKLLSTHGHDVHYWGMKHPRNPQYPHEDLFVEHVDMNAEYSVGKKAKIALKLLYSMEAKQKMEKLLKRIGKPDVVHLNNIAHHISPSILHTFNKYKIPVVMTMHDYKVVCAAYTLTHNGKPCERCKHGKHYQCVINKCIKKSRVKSILNTLEMFLHHVVLHIYDLVDTYIAPSAFMQRQLKAMGFSGEVKHVGNFVATNEYVPNYACEDVLFIYFGRLVREKGVETLIRAVQNVPATLKIIGDGPERERLREYVRHRGINNVEFCGTLRSAELKKEVKKSLAVIVPSEWYEVFGLVIIEAFALGKPVIAARIGAIPEIVRENERGLLFAPGEHTQLREKMEYLLNNPEKAQQMGKQARCYVEKEMNEKKYYHQLMDIYSTVQKKKQYSTRM